VGNGVTQFCVANFFFFFATSIGFFMLLKT
jgi:hypothetical protein